MGLGAVVHGGATMTTTPTSPLPNPGEEDQCVWQEIGDWAKALVVALAWFVLIALVSGSAVALVVLRWVDSGGV